MAIPCVSRINIPEGIPPELENEVITCLPATDLTNCFFVSKKWHGRVLQHWVDIWERTFPESPRLTSRAISSFFMRYAPHIVLSLPDLRNRLEGCIRTAAAGPPIRAVCFFPQHLPPSLELPILEQESGHGPVLIASFARSPSSDYDMHVTTKVEDRRHLDPSDGILPAWRRIFLQNSGLERLICLGQGQMNMEINERVELVNLHLNRCSISYILPFSSEMEGAKWRASLCRLLLEAEPMLCPQEEPSRSPTLLQFLTIASVALLTLAVMDSPPDDID